MTTAQSWRTAPAEPAPEDGASSRWSAYLPAVDGLRFFAFLMVFLFHFEEPFELDAWQGFERVGWVGVEIFFVISGFLMFYLLEREWEATGKIRIGQFYLRRVLRIYPLMLTYPLLMLLIFGPQNGFAGAWFASIAAFTAN
jgi:peptidoglycan/LPS O-acetylase OafA/YrhL